MYKNIAQLFKQHYDDCMKHNYDVDYDYYVNDDNNHKYIQHSLNKLLSKWNSFEIYCEFYAHEWFVFWFIVFYFN